MNRQAPFFPVWDEISVTRRNVRQQAATEDWSNSPLVLILQVFDWMSKRVCWHFVEEKWRGRQRLDSERGDIGPPCLGDSTDQDRIK